MTIPGGTASRLPAAVLEARGFGSRPVGVIDVHEAAPAHPHAALGQDVVGQQHAGPNAIRPAEKAKVN